MFKKYDSIDKIDLFIEKLENYLNDLIKYS